MFIIILFNINCSTKDNTQYIINFDNEKFKIPIKIKDFKKQHNLKYYVYIGFEGNTKNYTTILQLESQPRWTGSDNSFENDYVNKTVVGITFMSQENVYDSLRNNFEKHYKKKFDFINNINKMKITNQITLIIRLYKNRTYISYYYNIKEKDIYKYAKNVF